VFAEQLIDLVPSYTTLMVHYDLTLLSPNQARELIAEALIDLSPNAAAAAPVMCCRSGTT
jgi:allophanate hydrolase subunit 1